MNTDLIPIRRVTTACGIPCVENVTAEALHRERKAAS